ncbi:MAG: prepilin-type N-terminal cleavage/methylation domain-containing protein, partial [Proteobacteria bacterium]|nr:prepilin-type N-terminal cleavage/methylation domain-containing protein [Pseudomonadota bacterium]
MTVSFSIAQRSPRAFTLVELLVVLGLVSGLALLLLPAMARTRDTTRTHHCLSHLRQWGIATGLYEAFNWMGTLGGVAGGIIGGVLSAGNP